MANTAYQLGQNAAELYEQFTVPTGTRPTAERLLEHVHLGVADRVLDAACGTGIVVRLLIERGIHVARVVGLDVNANMLAVARSLKPEADFPLLWQPGDLRALPYPDAAFDVVLCNHGLQFVPDKALALAEMRRVLVPGGRLALTVWSASAPFNVARANALRVHLGEEIAQSALAPFAYRDATVIRQALEDGGFQEITMQEAGFTRALPATRACVRDMAARSAFATDIAEASAEVQQAFVEEVFAAMQPYETAGEFAEPMHIRVVVAIAPKSRGRNQLARRV